MHAFTDMYKHTHTHTNTYIHACTEIFAYMHIHIAECITLHTQTPKSVILCALFLIVGPQKYPPKHRVTSRWVVIQLKQSLVFSALANASDRHDRGQSGGWGAHAALKRVVVQRITQVYNKQKDIRLGQTTCRCVHMSVCIRIWTCVHAHKHAHTNSY